MSLWETPMVDAFWRSVGGAVIYEYPMVRRSTTAQRRAADAVIILEKPTEVADWRTVSLEGEDIIVVQAKASRLGMYLLGQALFSRELMRRFSPRSIRTVALCTIDDSELRPLAEAHGIEIVVIPAEAIVTRNGRRR